MNPAVILPTYNEAENITRLIDAILSIEQSMTVVVVDDNSPDGTWRIADEMASKDSHVRVIRRMEKRGRGYAGAEGFRYCVEQGFDPIIEMDADFSHDPKYLPEMIAALREYDVVLGSRAVAGGQAVGRSIVRDFITWGAATYLRLMLGVRVKDPTSGYRCFRLDAMKQINPATLTAPGPSIVTEVLYRCRNLRIKEIPIVFKDREEGQSKFGLKAMSESLRMAARLRIKGR